MDDLTHLRVQVLSLTFRAEEGTFAVARASPVNRPKQTVVVAGPLGDVNPGQVLSLRGSWEVHPRFGKQLRVHQAIAELPTSEMGIERFLSSGLVKGVGPGLAKRIVQAFGADTLDVICGSHQRLTRVEGIGAARARTIQRAVKGHRHHAETLAYLQSLGLGAALSSRVVETFGDRTAEVMREDPYRAAKAVSGVGFATADRLGKAQGMGPSDPRRARGVAWHLMQRASDRGHTFLPEGELRSQAHGLESEGPLHDDAVRGLAREGALVVDTGRVYTRGLYRAEQSICTRVARMIHRSVSAPTGSIAAPPELTEEQRDAVRASFLSGVLIITGGPGTGKTTTLRALVAAQEGAGRRVMLCAPTGRAARRMAETSGRSACTIHRLIEWNPSKEESGFNRDRPLKVDTLIVDEASMVDVPLGARLFDALPEGATLVLVGDADQLPPVGPGPVLRELLRSERVPTIRLNHVFRQAQQSAIVRAAHAVLASEVPQFSSGSDRASGQLFWVDCEAAAELGGRVQGILRRLEERYGYDVVRQVQVLSPSRRGEAGTEQLNGEVQRFVFGAEGRAESLEGRTLEPGDKVMQLRNDYEREVFNGDLGVVQSVGDGSIVVDMDGRLVRYDAKRRAHLDLAYACTVHKVQGSEFEAVVTVLHHSHHVLLSRALLYTALTRAKEVAVLVGDKRALRWALRNTEPQRVHCGLAEGLQAEASKAAATAS